jgi:peptide alpha-N-acetyltransferase
VLETEYDNAPALTLYDSLGFMREKRLFRFYLNGKDAFRLVLTLAPPGWDVQGDLFEHTRLPSPENVDE